ncbi:MAG: PHP domain-containing protein [Crenarchaeota archaeon]|jgi:ABC-type cobalamin/Fe3+-siderophores transport system ATPase subunit|nr:PHP domain-containing protein [Thermoproteota archaeon]
MNFVGSKWFKCDFHLHTTASECFVDKSVTPEQFIQSVVAAGLDCIAITDHNTNAGIDQIKEVATANNITVFPGVEITCDTSKIHLLVLFDPQKNSVDVGDFLVKCSIERSVFGKQEAHTSKSIFQIIEIAAETGAIVIPAHVDDFNGLGSISQANIDTLFDNDLINAVQITKKEFWENQTQLKDLQAIKPRQDSTSQPLSDFNAWHALLKKAVSKNLALLAFSDNPQGHSDPKHGLNGIGQQYTWVKMEQIPTLEGLRQAFLLPSFRIRNCFFCPDHPYRFPDLWLKSISIENTSITEETTPLFVEFSPQLTTIIGGRGSGKSSILRLIRGVFGKTTDLTNLIDVLKDHNDFYKRQDIKQLGVLSDKSKITISLVRNSFNYRVIASDIQNSSAQSRKVEVFDPVANQWNEVQEEGFIDFFEFEQFSQKQIYEIAQEPNSLRERIDSAISELPSVKKRKEAARHGFLEKSASIRTIQQQVSGKAKLQTEINDLASQIKLYQTSGIADLLISRQNFIAQEQKLSAFYTSIEAKELVLNNAINELSIEPPDLSSFSPDQMLDISAFVETAACGIASVVSVLKKQLSNIISLKTASSDSLEKSKWLSDFNANKNEFEQKKAELEKEGVADISNFENLTNKKNAKELELQQIQSIEENLAAELLARQKLASDHLSACKEITHLRQTFVASLTREEKVKIKIKPFRNKTDFVQKLRSILQKETGYEDDIAALANICFDGNVEKTIKSVVEIFLQIRRQIPVNEVGARFKTLVTKLTDAQVDEIELLLPEDEIEVQYQPTGSNVFKPLSTASAGQKTTAILTFILSHGNIPLILDQPEDDLDNRLVYELIVDRLRKSKEMRQIIVVTHNANIPVNGDAEHIVSMSSESKMIKVFSTGSVEQEEIKREICNVMEGSESAFQMRARRYKDIL